MMTFSPFWAILFETFELLQLLSFPFKAHAEFPWNEKHTKWFITFVNGSVPESLIIGKLLIQEELWSDWIGLGNETIFYIVLVLLGMFNLQSADCKTESGK